MMFPNSQNNIPIAGQSFVDMNQPPSATNEMKYEPGKPLLDLGQNVKKDLIHPDPSPWHASLALT
ncbi:hypothetical protein [Bradyrhizobium japonicum]|uniref:hypothetical protein n=1 Tax=Bradyrhizobium japonicum TaxID=375 RepID=UPI001AEBE892|nr:hypothetical protein [Bradyrhizobium japonicum]